MSFLASLFALDVTIFPHTTDRLSYPPGWIFPMICMHNLVLNPCIVCIPLTNIIVGPSAALSIPAIYLAFHVKIAMSIWEGLKGVPRIFWPKVKDESKTNQDDGTYATPLFLFVSQAKTVACRTLDAPAIQTADSTGCIEPQPINQVSKDRDEVDIENCRPKEEPSSGIMRRIKRVL
jgi:hypothetical protein